MPEPATPPAARKVRNTSRRKAGKAAAALLTIGAVVVLPATPAHAAEYYMETNDGRPGGTVLFTADGDRVHLCDIQQDDNRGVRLRVKNVTKDPDRMEYDISREGQGCIDVNAAMEQPYNLAEKHCFRFTIWIEGRWDESVDWAQWRNYNNDSAKNCDGVD